MKTAGLLQAEAATASLQPATASLQPTADPTDQRRTWWLAPQGHNVTLHKLGSWWKICLGEEQQFAAFHLQEMFQSQGEGIIINQQGRTGRALPSNEYLITRAERQRQSIKYNWWVTDCQFVPSPCINISIGSSKNKKYYLVTFSPKKFWKKVRMVELFPWDHFLFQLLLGSGKYCCSPMFLVLLLLPKLWLPLQTKYLVFEKGWFSVHEHL